MMTEERDANEEAPAIDPTTGEPEASATEETQAYKLHLPAFEGPLDLLLHLIRQHKVDVYDIPIVLITRQYNEYLDAMTQLDLEIAADYIYMAALLIHIKSKMLLPRDETEEPTEDPRAELVEKLLEYQRFKSVAESFAEIDHVRMGVWSRPPSPTPGAEPAEIDISEVSLFDLIDAFRTALQRFRRDHPQAIELKRLTHKVSDKMLELMDELAQRSPMRLLWFLEGRDRGELVAIFLGLLELVRLGAISLTQSEVFGEVVVQKTEKEVDTEHIAALYDN